MSLRGVAGGGGGVVAILRRARDGGRQLVAAMQFGYVRLGSVRYLLGRPRRLVVVAQG